MTLPQGWAKATLGDVADFVMGQAPPGSDCNFDGVGTPFVKAGEFGDRGPVIREWTTTPLKMAAANDVLICVVGATAGKLNRGADCAIGRSVAAIRPSEATSADFIYPRLKSEVLRLRTGSTGTAQGVISQDMLREIELDLPPAAEQRRIVAKLDELTARLDRARAELDRVPVLVESLRRASLNAAFRGDLSADQRPEDDGTEKQHAPELDNQERGIWRSDGLPETWRWVEFEEFLADQTDTKRKLPEKEYAASGLFPVIDQGMRHVGGYTSRADLVHPALTPVIVFGDHTRCVKLVDPPFVQGADGVKVLAPAPGVAVAYARYALLAVDIPAKGYSRHMKFVRKTIWPLPSPGEQAVIVARLDAAFARADRLKVEAARARALLDRLESAILAKAFRGELVPQDPDDEPASVLLERIRAERATAPKAKRGRRAPAKSVAPDA